MVRGVQALPQPLIVPELHKRRREWAAGHTPAARGTLKILRLKALQDFQALLFEVEADRLATEGREFLDLPAYPATRSAAWGAIALREHQDLRSAVAHPVHLVRHQRNAPGRRHRAVQRHRAIRVAPGVRLHLLDGR